MSKIICQLMDKEIKNFTCGNDSIDREIEDSYYATLLKQAYGYQIKIDNKIVGYYMLYFKNINMQIVNDIMEDEYDSNLVNYYMAVHLRYLAISEQLQHKSIGTVVLRGIINEILKLSKTYPIRIITLDALLEYYEWYKKIGFRDIPGKEKDGITIAMYMDCMSIEEAEKLQDYCADCL